MSNNLLADEFNDDDDFEVEDIDVDVFLICKR